MSEKIHLDRAPANLLGNFKAQPAVVKLLVTRRQWQVATDLRSLRVGDQVVEIVDGEIGALILDVLVDPVQ